MKTKQCPFCNEVIAKQSKQCPKCGKKLKNKGCGCFIGLAATFLIIFSVVLTNTNTSEIPNTTTEQAKSIEQTILSCGFTKINSAKQDELLNNAHFEGETGYRVQADGLQNIILYLNADKQVYNIKYADNDLYLNGQVLSKITDYTFTTDEKTNYQIMCTDKIKSLLKSPSTAKFPNITKWGFKKENGTVTVQSYVDSQNSFGAELRSEFQFKIDIKSQVINSLIFDGKEYIK